MEVAGAVIGQLIKKMLFDEGWRVKVKGHLVHGSGAEIIQLEDGPASVLARRASGAEKHTENLFAAIRYVKGIDN
jgi:hypothetical protein